VSERVVMDDATIVMRSRFLSGSERISSHLSWLEEHTEEIRADVRDSLSASAEKIRTTLNHLTGQMDRLPEAQWEQFKAMLLLLRAQQDVLDSAEALIQKARANVVSRKRSVPEAAATSDVASVSGGPGHSLAVALGAASLRLVAVARDAASLRLVVVGIVAVGLIFGYMTFTRDGDRQHVATKSAAPIRGDNSRPVAPAAAPRAGAPARASYDMATTPSPPSEGPQAGHATSISTTVMTSHAPGLVAATVPAPLPSAPATERPDTAAIARSANERFVPVVFTGKDQAQVLRTFAVLQTRYPTLLSPRRAEAQPVDLGQKGIWHRLIVLPPGSRQSAVDFCDQLMAAGYDRCWVKGY
jgi:hypothetical protein